MARSTTTTRTTTPAEASAFAPTVELLDPATLLVDVNVRHDARLDPAFVASIKEHGVLVPIVAVRTTEGEVRVRFGHRRTLAAIEGDRPVVPVVIVADEASDTTSGDTAAHVERIIGQWAENEHRTGLSVAERVDALAQLAAFGVSPAQIAKRTKTGRAEVDAALTVAGSDLAKAAADRYDFLDLTQAALIAEFASDTDAVAALVAAAKDGRFDHVAQRLRDDRAEQTRRDALAQELTAAGITVIPTPRHGEQARDLNLLDGADGKTLTVEDHRECPGHAAFIALMHGYLDPTTGAPLAEDDPPGDASLDDDEDLEDEDLPDQQNGVAAPLDAAERPRATWGAHLAVRYACTDPAAFGHRDRFATRHRPEKRRAEDMDEGEREAAREERREVVECNKAWASAAKVRRAWLKTFAARKTPPKGAAAFLATALATDAEILAGIGGNHLAADLLGCPDTGYGRNTALQALPTQAGEPRALVIALVQVLAAYEDRTDRDDWRHHRAHTARYLGWLAANGYTLAEVEQRACATTGDAD
jgi:ParB family transcriptional regulator, chromosome partitioning protein